MSRRLLLLAVAFVVAPGATAAQIVACAREPHADVSRTTEETIDQARVVRMFLHGASEASPLVVGLHGRGGSPENFSRAFAAYPGTIELALVQGFFREGPGFRWVDVGESADEDDLGKALAASEVRLWPILEKIARGRPIILVGFSQGAFMTYALATKHPDAIAYAFPMGGGEPAMLRPHDHTSTAPVHALHGTDDRRVAVAWDRATVDAFQKNGSVADLREFPGTGHVISPDMRDDLFAHVQAVAALLPAGPPDARASGSSGATGASPRAPAASTEVGLLQRSLLGTQRVADTVQSLTDEVGPRLAGSTADARAVAWAERAMTQRGLVHVRVEPVTEPAWERGTEIGRASCRERVYHPV